MVFKVKYSAYSYEGKILAQKVRLYREMIFMAPDNRFIDGKPVISENSEILSEISEN